MILLLSFLKEKSQKFIRYTPVDFTIIVNKLSGYIFEITT